MRFRDLKLKTKQLIGFSLILVIMGGLNIFSVMRMNALTGEINKVTTHWLTSAIAIAKINHGISDLRINQLQHAFATTETDKQARAAAMAALIEKIHENQDTYEPLIADSRERQLYSQFEQKWERYLDLGYEFLELSLANDNQRAIALLTDEALKVFNDLSSDLDALVAVNQRASVDAAKRAESTFVTTRRIVRILQIVTVILSMLIAWLIVRHITIPLKQLVTGAESVAGGNIDVTLDVLGNDEVGNVSNSFNRMTQSLREARDKIVTHQQKLESTNKELENKTHTLEEAMKQLKDTQQQLIMKEKMASLGDLVAGVAHEINNPVGAVGSAADTSARSLEIVGESLDRSRSIKELTSEPKFTKALKVLKSNNDLTLEASRRIARIVRSLKNFARLDEAEFQDADVHEGLDSTITLLDHRIKNGITINRRYGELPRINCFPNQLNQVFMNVLSNAEQSIDGEGTITITSTKKDKAIVIEISDDGRGIKQDHLQKIFDPGFTTKGVGVGTGLGLSISYNIVKKHHGDITLESSEGKGTTVTIVLPVKQ